VEKVGTNTGKEGRGTFRKILRRSILL